MEPISTLAVQPSKVVPPAPHPNGAKDWVTIIQKTLSEIPATPDAGKVGLPKEIEKLFDYQKKVATWQLNVELVTRVVDAGLGMARKLQQGNL